MLKAKIAAPAVHPNHMNLVAPTLKLADLPKDDPALVELRREVNASTGLPGELMDAIVHTLAGADHLGTLLRVDEALDDAIAAHDPGRRLALDVSNVRDSLMERLGHFLSAHSTGDDLGLRLRGEQLGTGVRFLEIARSGTYHVVVGNPPYQGTKWLRRSTSRTLYPLAWKCTLPYEY